MFWSSCRCQRVSGTLLMVVGLLSDTLVGVLFLLHGGWQILCWHLPCGLLWSVGINLIARQDERPLTFSLASLNKWGLTALFLGVGTFPGFGVWAYSLAFLLISSVFAAHVLPCTPLPDLEPQDSRLHFVEQAEQGRVVLPLVDELREGNTEARRIVVAKMSRAAHPDATRLLRQLLSDRQAEIRSDASVALARLEDEKSRDLNVAFEAWSANPVDASLALALADHYYQYAASNVLDRMSQRFYLAQARDLLLQVVAREPDRDAHLWLMLARIRQRLGERAEALHAALHSLHMQPDLPEASLLAMELAFATHAWDTLAELADKDIHARSAHMANDPLLKSLKQWVTPRPQMYASVRL